MYYIGLAKKFIRILLHKMLWKTLNKLLEANPILYVLYKYIDLWEEVKGSRERGGNRQANNQYEHPWLSESSLQLHTCPTDGCGRRIFSAPGNLPTTLMDFPSRNCSFSPKAVRSSEHSQAFIQFGSWPWSSR